jgi:hypothetical protein
MSALRLRMDDFSSSHPMQNWRQTSVRDFFIHLNWEGHSSLVEPVVHLSTEPSSGPLSLTMSVNRFFSALNWEGGDVGVPGSLPAKPSTPSLVIDELTLDGFSDLF